jgi:hypothetical protein
MLSISRTSSPIRRPPAIFDQIAVDIAKAEQQIADLYHARRRNEKTDPATPTTGAAVSA